MASYNMDVQAVVMDGLSALQNKQKCSFLHDLKHKQL